MRLWSITYRWFGCLLGGVLLSALVGELSAQVVPGTGNLMNYDDLEDVNWGYTHNFPKSSKEEDENIRYPLGFSTNRMWSESPKRGSPDTIRRCETPAGGLTGSTGSLYLRTRDSGIPGYPGSKQAQDDFILAARPVAVGYSPNFVVRVFLPEWEAWEQRQGVSFGIRVGLQGMMTKEQPVTGAKRFFRTKKTESVTEMEPYYPGFFIAFNPVTANNKSPYAQVLIRSDHMGREVPGPTIKQTGWWTFGMSVTADSRCHYYAHAGITDLKANDHIYSSLPYNIRGEHFNTIFFNVCSADNASAWSTPWIIDDPKVYYSGPPVFNQNQQAQQQQPVKTVQAPANGVPVQSASQAKEIPAPMTPAPVAPVAIPPAALPAAPAIPAPASIPLPPPILSLQPAKPISGKTEAPAAPMVPMTTAEPVPKSVLAPRPVSVPPSSGQPAPAAPILKPLAVLPMTVTPMATAIPELKRVVSVDLAPFEKRVLLPAAVPAPPSKLTTIKAKSVPLVKSGESLLVPALIPRQPPEAATDLRQPAPGEPKAEPVQTAQAEPPTSSTEPPLVAPELEDESIKVDSASVPVPPEE